MADHHALHHSIDSLLKHDVLINTGDHEWSFILKLLMAQIYIYTACRVVSSWSVYDSSWLLYKSSSPAVITFHQLSAFCNARRYCRATCYCNFVYPYVCQSVCMSVTFVVHEMLSYDRICNSLCDLECLLEVVQGQATKARKTFCMTHMMLHGQTSVVFMHKTEAKRRAFSLHRSVLTDLGSCSWSIWCDILVYTYKSSCPSCRRRFVGSHRCL